MPSLLVKEISADLLREVNYLASKAGQTQREWVIEQLVKAVEAPEKPAPTASDIDFEPEPPRPPPVKKTKPEMPAGLSNTQMQRWIREHR